MRSVSFSRLILGTACALLLICAAVRADALIDFNRQIRPILSENCFACHGPDSKKRKADLRFDRKEGAFAKAKTGVPVVNPGKSAESEIIDRITTTDMARHMPPEKSGKTLTNQQMALLRQWIDQGASWPNYWAFTPPKRAAVPAVRDAAWVRNPIDAFILARLEAENLHPSPEADKTTLIRRVSLDLTGLPPTPAEVDAFLADASPEAYEKVVDRLLKSPGYGERMAMQWLDGARYADSNGYQADYERFMWPWRDWVIDAYNTNKPFDQFTIEQIAGDMLPNATLNQRVASGFNRNHRINTEGGIIAEEWRVETVIDRVEATSSVWLGLTMGCARCHDHKYDPITQKEFYQFSAFYNNVAESGVGAEQPVNHPPLAKAPRLADKEKLQELQNAIEQATQNRDASDSAEADKKLAAAVKAKEDFDAKLPTVMVMAELPQPRDAFVLIRGQYDKHGDKVTAGLPVALPPMPEGAPMNRLGLAQWIADPSNPLTARVAVNRFWERFFGVGIVKTSENFGSQGEPPSHAELLDWLATEFARLDWDMKAIQKEIVLSAAYRQTSKTTAELFQRDPENRLLSRGPRFRLQAEAVRDNALAISGLLVDKVGGPSVRPYQPQGVWDETNVYGNLRNYKHDEGESLYRRTMYTIWKRTAAPPTMLLFDSPSREVCTVKRSRTDTPLQALALLNEVTYVEASRVLAERMIHEGGASPEERITYAFRRAVARKPSAAELKVLASGLQRRLAKYQAEPDAAKKLLTVGDYKSDPKLDPIELAAYAMTASVILNLDETINRE